MAGNQRAVGVLSASYRSGEVYRSSFREQRRVQTVPAAITESPTGPDEQVVAAILNGNLRIWDAAIKQYSEDRIAEHRFAGNDRLWSLCETLINWRIHTIGGPSGTLKSWVPKLDDTHIAANAIQSAVFEMLTAVGMAGESYEYGECDDMQTFDGWAQAEISEIAGKYSRPRRIEAAKEEG